MGLGAPNSHCISLHTTSHKQIGAILLPNIPDASQFPESYDMSSAADQLARVANAEKHLCEQAAPVFARLIQEIEKQLEIKIGEVRITMNPSEVNRSWGGINCVITQADFGPRCE